MQVERAEQVFYDRGDIFYFVLIVQCHARKRKILCYLHMPKTTSMCYIYEATIVFKILMQLL